MRKPNKHLERVKQENAEKINERKRRNRQIRQERLNHRSNVIEAKKNELFEKWVAAVSKHFEESHKEK